MVFIPVGLKSKVKDPPFVVAVIVVLTAFASIANFKYLDQYHVDYIQSQERQKYFFDLRSIYVNACDAFQDEKTCDYLIKFKNDDSIRNPYVANDDAKRYLINASTADLGIYSNWHDEDFMIRRLEQKQKTEELNALRIVSFNNKNVLGGYHEKYGLLSLLNTTPYTLAKAQFTHSDWFHLLGNLVFFLFFGACLEQAMGRKWLLGIYFLGGTIGLLSQVAALSSETLYVVGASANIFACAGAFLRLYWKQPLQLFFSFFFVMNRNIKLPTWSFFVFFVLIQQVTGLTNGDGTGIAYMAHLVGLAVGFGAAHLWSKRTKFEASRYSVFPYEKEMLASVEARGGCKEKYNALVDLLFYAPVNIEAYKKFHAVHTACGCDPKCLSQGSLNFFTHQVSTLIKELCLDQEIEAAAGMYSITARMNCEASVVIRHLTATDIMVLGNHLYKKNEHESLKGFFAAAAQIFPEEQKQVFAQFLDSLEREKAVTDAS